LVPDHLETEIKFVLRDPVAMRNRLLALGAVSLGHHDELNILLDDHARTLTTGGSLLRIRCVGRSDTTPCLLTVKTPVGDPDRDFKVRREIEFSVSDRDAVLAALAVLGYVPCWRYEKRRETFSWQEMVICLDELAIGWFVELEGPKEQIRQAADALDLSMDAGIVLSYAGIFDYVRRVLKLEAQDLTFEALAGVVVDPQVYDELTGPAR
jgi:predicted adenylyl cyclase CyaB